MSDERTAQERAEDAADAHHDAWRPTLLFAQTVAARDRLLSGQPTGLPDGTSTEFAFLADAARDEAESATADGTATWLHLLEADQYRVAAEVDPLALRGLLVKLAGTALAWVSDLDDRARTIEPNPFVATVVGS